MPFSDFIYLIGYARENFFLYIFTQGRSGKKYILGKKNYSWKIPEFFANELRREQGWRGKDERVRSLSFWKLYWMEKSSSGAWRTLSYQEVRLWIGPLAKLGRFKSTADNILVYIVTISLASGPIRSLTSCSWYAKVLHAQVVF